MDSQGKFHSPQNISGALEENDVVASSWTAEVDGDLLQNIKETPGRRLKMVPYSLLKARVLKLIWKNIIYTLFNAKISAAIAKLNR